MHGGGCCLDILLLISMYQVTTTLGRSPADVEGFIQNTQLGKTSTWWSLKENKPRPRDAMLNTTVCLQLGCSDCVMGKFIIYTDTLTSLDKTYSVFSSFQHDKPRPRDAMLNTTVCPQPGCSDCVMGNSVYTNTHFDVSR